MSYRKAEFTQYMHDVKGNMNPGAYANALENIERILSVDIDEEYAKDGCKSLYDRLQELRKHPERINKNEPAVRQYASRLNKYMEFREWETNPERVNKSRDKTGVSSIGDDGIVTTRYWVAAEGDNQDWRCILRNRYIAIGWPELGDLIRYDDKSAIISRLNDASDASVNNTRNAHMIWSFVHEINPGDVILVRRGGREIIARGIVESPYEYDESQGECPNIHRVKWTDTGSWKCRDMSSLLPFEELTNYPAWISDINLTIDQSITNTRTHSELPRYTEDDFLEEVYISAETYEEIVEVLKEKKNIILQGPPGVGKTFLSKRLAYSMMGVKDIDRVCMIQFHQSYSYEDFLMGFRPSEQGFVLSTGSFYDFCKRAEIDSENDYFFIIDEFNRGNISKIFGELFMLIEADKRGGQNKIRLLYNDELFSIPQNVYIIGMMNTADRSLAMMDYALHRRFSFFDLYPAFASEGFNRYRSKLGNPKLNALIQRIQDLNSVISEDDSLGEGFCIGHSFFCNLSERDLASSKLKHIVEYELIPLLKEYWFDDSSKVREWADLLRGAIQ